MIIMSTVCNKFITLANSSSDIIDAESFKVGAKICNKLMESVVSKKASTQIELPPTIPLKLPSKTLQKTGNMLNLTNLYDSTHSRNFQSFEQLPSVSTAPDDDDDDDDDEGKVV